MTTTKGLAPEGEAPLTPVEAIRREVRMEMLRRGYTYRTLALAIGEIPGVVQLTVSGNRPGIAVRRKIEKLFGRAFFWTETGRQEINRAEKLLGFDPYLVKPAKLRKHVRSLGIVIEESDAGPDEIVEIINGLAVLSPAASTLTQHLTKGFQEVAALLAPHLEEMRAQFKGLSADAIFAQLQQAGQNAQLPSHPVDPQLASK